MAAKTGVNGIDPKSWQVSILPSPKGFSRGMAYGFCDGHAVGNVEKLRSATGSLACWWPEGKPELLTLEGQQNLGTGAAGGDVVPGHWKDAAGSMRAVFWTKRSGRLVATPLHDKAWARTWATAVGGGAVAGMGTPVVQKGQYARTVGLLWRGKGAPTELAAESDAALYATDGTRVAGSVRGRAMLWPSPDAAPVDLTPAKMQMAEVQ